MGKKKSRRNNKKVEEVTVNDIVKEDPPEEKLEDLDFSDLSDEGASVPAQKKKKKKKKKAQPMNAFDMLADDDDDESNMSEDFEPRSSNQTGGFGALMEGSEDEALDDGNSELSNDETEIESAPTKKLTKKQLKKLKKEKKSQPEDDNIDDFLDEFQEEAPKKLTKSQLKRLKKKEAYEAKKAAEAKKTEELKNVEEDIFAEFAAPAPTEQKLSKSQLKRLKKKQGAAEAQKAEESKVDKKGNDDDMFDEFLVDTPVEKKLSKAQLKRLRKKEAEQKAAEQAESQNVAPTSVDDTEAKTEEPKKLTKNQLKRLRKKQKEEEAAAKGKKKKGLSALKQRLLKQQAEEEALRKAAEEARIAAEEEEKRLIEEEKRKEELRLKKLEEKRLRRIQLKKEGKLLTAKEKAAKKKAEAARAQLLASQGINIGGTPQKKKSQNYKKKPKNKKPTLSAAQLQAEQIRREREEAQKKQEEEKKRKEDEERLKKEQEALLNDNWDALLSDEDEEDDEEEYAWDVDDDVIEAAKAEKQKKKEERLRLKMEEMEKKKQALLAEQKDQERKQAEEVERKRLAKQAEKEKAEKEKKKRKKNKVKAEDLRSPICCILGHVDTGKTKLLDKIRQTDVQDKEAGGITQQIGATYFPQSAIIEKTEAVTKLMKNKLEIMVPGLLVIDTPGHESFTNLRSRGSNLCDIAILVVDLMHGLEPQTIESIKLLRDRKTPFIVALNKIDRLYGWKATPNEAFVTSFKNQGFDTKSEFDKRVKETIAAFAMENLNCALYHENKDVRSVCSLVPTSAITGEGIPDLLSFLVKLTQERMNQKLAYLSELQCTVLEVKMIEGLGTTIDVVVVNGVLKEGATIVVCGLAGPIVTTIRALMTPQPMKEIRVRGEYVHHKSVKAAIGVKISAQGLESAVAGTQLLVCGPNDDIEDLKDEVMQDLATILSKIDKSGLGVFVQASTLGSLEALLQFLKDSKIPVSGIEIGPVHQKSVKRASIMLERGVVEYATILAFDVKVDPEATRLAEELGVKIFSADIIYKLFDLCTEYMEQIRQAKREDVQDEAIFPCILEMIPAYIFNKKNPIVVGVDVLEGYVKLGTPLCLPSKNKMVVGTIISIQKDKEELKEAKAGDQVCIKIDTTSLAPHIMYGRHFDCNDKLVSKLTRKSIDLLKENFKDDLDRTGWMLVVKLKKMLNIGLMS